MNKIVFFVACLICSFQLFAQQSSSTKFRPTWLSVTPTAGNETYYFPSDLPKGEGKTVNEARIAALSSFIVDLAHKKGVSVSGREISEMVFQQSDTGTTEAQNYSNKFTITANTFTVSFNAVDDYWTYSNGSYTCWVLVQVAYNPSNVSFDRVIVTNKYGLSGLSRSLIPGYGQMYKGSYAKGGIIIAAEALGVGGIVASYSMKSSYEKLIREDPKHMDVYSNKADMWTNIAYGSIAFTAAVYIYNLIDAAVSPGAKHIIIDPNKRGFSFSPMVSPRGEMGIQLTYRF